MENKKNESAPIYNKIGLRIRDARTAKKQTQDDLGFMVGVSGQYISLIELGKTNIGSIDLLIKLMNALELSPNELFCDYVDSAKEVLVNELVEQFEDCSPDEIQILKNITKVVREQFNNYIPNTKKTDL